MKVVSYECPICGQLSSPEDGLLPAYTAPFEQDAVRSLFVTPSLHWTCFYTWNGRSEFARESFDYEVARYLSSPLHGTACADDEIAVFVSVAEPMFLSIVNRQTGRPCALTQQQWVAWQAGDYAIDQSLHENELQFIANALSRFWHQFPDKISFQQQTDWTDTERHLYTSP